MKFVVALSTVLISASLGLLAVGCSSSQEAVAAPSAAPSNPLKRVSADAQVNAILVRSCYNCHSIGGSAPWYAVISPTYLAANSARKALNFSDWQTYDAEKKAAELKGIVKSVSAGSMPPRDYSALDHSARLGDDEKRTLLNWASQTAIAAH